jgi:lysophospholipase L1-like esterase
MASLRRTIATTFVGAILAGGCGQAAESPDHPPTPLPRQAGCSAAGDAQSLCIVILGDSVADGTPLTGDDRWWVRLRALLGSALPDRHVVVDSWAVPGSRVDVLESAARDQPALASYDLAIVIEGVNDEVVMPIEAWRQRYEAAIAAIDAARLIVVVGTPPPTFDNGAFASRYDATAAAIRAIASEHRPLLDIAARWHADGAAVAATYYSDLIHQGPIGQRLMAELARDVVLEAMCVQ